jgi:hypothetical protein
MYKTLDTRAFRDTERGYGFVERKRICLDCRVPVKTIEIPQAVWDQLEFKEKA